MRVCLLFFSGEALYASRLRRNGCFRASAGSAGSAGCAGGTGGVAGGAAGPRTRDQQMLTHECLVIP